MCGGVDGWIESSIEKAEGYCELSIDGVHEQHTHTPNKHITRYNITRKTRNKNRSRRGKWESGCDLIYLAGWVGLVWLGKQWDGMEWDGFRGFSYIESQNIKSKLFNQSFIP